MKKLLMAYKYRNSIDNFNIFHYEGLKIVNINTTYESYYDDKLKKIYHDIFKDCFSIDFDFLNINID